jgi:hypothetical protein
MATGHCDQGGHQEADEREDVHFSHSIFGFCKGLHQRKSKYFILIVGLLPVKKCASTFFAGQMLPEST